MQLVRTMSQGTFQVSKVLVNESIRLLYLSWMDQIFRLRYNVYSSIDVVDKNDYPDGRIMDKYDLMKNTIHFVVVQNLKVVGCVRVIPQGNQKLPFEHDFPIEYYMDNMGKTIEECCPFADTGRLVVDPDTRGKKIGTFLSYTAQMFALDKLGARYVFSVWNPKFKGPYEVGVRPLGRPKVFTMGSKSREHLAYASYLTKKNITRPRDLINYSDNCYMLMN